jgi:isopenicillin-N epimerase
MAHPLWQIRSDTTYLNHGSFGPPSRPVIEARRQWQEELDQQPMDVFVRRQESALLAAQQRLASWLGTSADNLALIDNATWAMNVVAESVVLGEGDNVVLSDHEYGAVERIWQRACLRSSAELKTAVLPSRFEDPDEVVDAVLAACDERTRLIVVSHITSPTAVTLPIARICERARQLGIAVCVDGPHAPAQIPLDLDQLGCDFYTASCHKWLSASFGSGFLYVHPRYQPLIRPLFLSWGKLPPEEPSNWYDEFLWLGTRDISALLTIPVAIDVLEGIGLEHFRQQGHQLACFARQQLVEKLGARCLVADDPCWYSNMAHVELPVQDASGLQQALWDQYRIEVPVVYWQERWFIRVSCYLYNEQAEVEQLVEAVAGLLSR